LRDAGCRRPAAGRRVDRSRGLFRKKGAGDHPSKKGPGLERLGTWTQVRISARGRARDH